jgi:putative transposase
MSRDVTIVQGSIGKDHVHMLVSCLPTIAPAKLVQYLKGRSSRMIQEEFPHLKKKILGTAYVGARIFLCNNRNGNGRDHTPVYSESENGRRRREFQGS